MELWITYITMKQMFWQRARNIVAVFFVGGARLDTSFFDLITGKGARPFSLFGMIPAKGGRSVG